MLKNFQQAKTFDMNFPSSAQESNRFYNNADSFSMAFDNAWKKLFEEENEISTSKEERVKTILSKIEDHPFLKESPEKAQEIAYFRIRLLKLK